MAVIFVVMSFSTEVNAISKKKDKKTNWSSFDFSDLAKGKIPGPVKKRYSDVKRVFIADVVINQQVFSKYSKTSYGGLGHGSSKAKMEANLGGIDFGTYQNAVAEIYERIAQIYTELGYELVTEEEVMATELYNNRETGKRIVAANASEVEPVRYGDGGLNKLVSVRPTNKLVVYNDAKKDVLTKGGAPWKVYFKLANELDALVVGYSFNASFVDMSGKGGYFSTSAKVKATPYLSIYNGNLITLAPSTKTTQPTTGSFYQTEPLEGNNDGWISPDGFKTIDESESSYYWTGSANKKVENVMMVNPIPFVEEVSSITTGLADALTHQFISGIE